MYAIRSYYGYGTPERGFYLLGYPKLVENGGLTLIKFYYFFFIGANYTYKIANFLVYTFVVNINTRKCRIKDVAQNSRSTSDLFVYEFRCAGIPEFGSRLFLV